MRVGGALITCGLWLVVSSSLPNESQQRNSQLELAADAERRHLICPRSADRHDRGRWPGQSSSDVSARSRVGRFHARSLKGAFP